MDPPLAATGLSRDGNPGGRAPQESNGFPSSVDYGLGLLHYTDSRGTRRGEDFLILGPTGGLLVLEVKSRLLILAHQFPKWR